MTTAWTGIIGLEEADADDGRRITQNAVDLTGLPVPIFHLGLAGEMTHIGRVERAWRVPGTELNVCRDDATAIWAEGTITHNGLAPHWWLHVGMNLIDVEFDLPADEDEIADALLGDGQLRVSAGRLDCLYAYGDGQRPAWPEARILRKD